MEGRKEGREGGKEGGRERETRQDEDETRRRQHERRQDEDKTRRDFMQLFCVSTIMIVDTQNISTTTATTMICAMSIFRMSDKYRLAIDLCTDLRRSYVNQCCAYA